MLTYKPFAYIIFRSVYVRIKFKIYCVSLLITLKCTINGNFHTVAMLLYVMQNIYRYLKKSCISFSHVCTSAMLVLLIVRNKITRTGLLPVTFLLYFVKIGHLFIYLNQLGAQSTMISSPYCFEKGKQNKMLTCYTKFLLKFIVCYFDLLHRTIFFLHSMWQVTVKVFIGFW